MKKGYLAGVISEAKKTEWPKGKKLKNMVISVLGVGVVFIIIFFAMDTIINLIMRAMGI